MRCRYHALTDLTHTTALQGKIKSSKKNMDESKAALIPTLNLMIEEEML
jgi:hypothetical protein